MNDDAVSILDLTELSQSHSQTSDIFFYEAKGGSQDSDGSDSSIPIQKDDAMPLIHWTESPTYKRSNDDSETDWEDTASEDEVITINGNARRLNIPIVVSKVDKLIKRMKMKGHISKEKKREARECLKHRQVPTEAEAMDAMTKYCKGHVWTCGALGWKTMRAYRKNKEMDPKELEESYFQVVDEFCDSNERKCNEIFDHVVKSFC